MTGLYPNILFMLEYYINNFYGGSYEKSCFVKFVAFFDDRLGFDLCQRRP
jgi:hypothetical protein